MWYESILKNCNKNIRKYNNDFQRDMSIKQKFWMWSIISWEGKICKSSENTLQKTFQIITIMALYAADNMFFDSNHAFTVK